MNQNSRDELSKRRAYMLAMHPVLNKKALFSDTTETFCSNASAAVGETVKLRFRAAKNNVDAIYVVTMRGTYLMEKEFTQNGYDYYAYEVVITDTPFRYYFRVEVGHWVYFYNTKGVSLSHEERAAFCIIPEFETPKWAKGAIFYQIFVDRFCNGDPTNDVLDSEYNYIQEPVKQVKDWGRYPAAMDVRDFYGGDLQGVMNKLDYLKELGVDVIYFNPLFVSPSNHKYDIQDYDYIDPHFGKIVEDGGEVLDTWESDNRQATKYIQRVTNKKNLEASNQLFIRLVEEAHKRGIRVILDGVFNHCGSFNKWIDRECLYEKQPGYEPGAFISARSPYHSYYKFYNNQWPYNSNYEGWWGHNTLPKLNYEQSEELCEEILRIARKWVSAPYNVDGWRLDVAADLGFSQEFNHEFWRRFRKAVKEANPDALILAEHYGDPSSWLGGDQWDSVMNYDAFMEPVTWFLTGMEKHSDAYRGDLKNNVESFRASMYYHMASFSVNSLQVAMNELSNHDHSRFLTRTNGKVGRIATLGSEAASEGIKKAVMREAVVMMMTWPGAPTIYYGDEVGVCGFTDPDNRRTYPWGKEDMELLEFHRDMIAIHKEFPVLTHGSIRFLHCNHSHVLCYGRFDLKEQVVVVVNNTEAPLDVEVNVWSAGMPKYCEVQMVMETTRNGYSIGRRRVAVKGGILKQTIGPESAQVFVYREENEE